MLAMCLNGHHHMYISTKLAVKYLFNVAISTVVSGNNFSKVNIFLISKDTYFLSDYLPYIPAQLYSIRNKLLFSC